jgi:hypothetical protein
MPIPIFWPSVSPELLADGLSGSEVEEALVDEPVAVDCSLDEAVVETLLALDVGDAVGQAVEGPYSTMR